MNRFFASASVLSMFDALTSRAKYRSTSSPVNKSTTIMWSETLKKEARGLDTLDLGEVQAVEPYYVKTERGVLKRETFYLPRDLAEAFDGSTLWFGITAAQAEREFRRDVPPTEEEYMKYCVAQPIWSRTSAHR